MIRLNKMMIICPIQMKIHKKQKKDQNCKIQAKNFGKMVTKNKHQTTIIHKIRKILLNTMIAQTLLKKNAKKFNKMVYIL
jgi:hypothetical protein